MSPVVLPSDPGPDPAPDPTGNALEIRMLGGLAVRRDARAVDLPTRKAAGLLAVLALRPGQTIPRDRLADLFWSRSAPPQARASLRQALAQLRRALGRTSSDTQSRTPSRTGDGPVADPFETPGDGVRLRPEAVAVDAATLEAALGDGSPAALERAAALYRGDLLAGFAVNEAPFEDWVQAESERLRRRTLGALTAHLERRVVAGEVEPALDLGERLLELDPLAEEVHRALIRLDIDRGALGSAMRRFERCRARLAECLGVAPSPATRALLAAIRARPPEGPALGAAGGIVLGSPPATPADPYPAAANRLQADSSANPALNPAIAAVADPHPCAPPLLAVLPFVDRSPDGSQGHLALGFAEEVVRALTRFRTLRVMAAQSSFALVRVTPGSPGAGPGPWPAALPAALDPVELGGRLGARYLLAGSVAAAGEALRIGAELLDAASGHCLWSERWDASASEVFAAQDEISRAVAAALAVRIDAERLRAAARRPVGSLAAYDCWLRGLAKLREGTYGSLVEARPFFERALAIDRGFARAYTGLSLTHFNEWSCTAWERWDENERRAFEYAAQGARLDDTDHMTQFVLGRILLYRRDFERAERHLVRAESLNPNDADMLAQLAFSDACLGEAARGLGRAELARRLNPFHDDWYFAFACGTALLARDPDATIDLGHRAPTAATDIHAGLACAHALRGELDEAQRHRDAYLALFKRRIAFGREPAPGEPVRWLLHVNPLRREEDRAFLLDALARSGLTLAG